MQYIVLVLGEIVQLGQLIHGFAVDGDMKDVFSLLLRVGVVLGGFGSGVYFFNLVGDFVHSPKGVLDALHLGGIDNDNVAIRVEVGMYCKDGQHLRPVACPCMTVLVVVGDGGFAALRVGGYDVIDGCAETVTEGYFLPHYRVLNLENGEFSEEMNLKDSQGNFLTSLTVVKDQFCVVYDYTSVNIAVADDNTMENVLIPKYALLSQDDYFHSRDNFHPISNDSF